MHRLARLASLLLLVSLIAIVTASAVLSAEKSAKLLPVRLAVVSRSTLDLPFWVAREQGFFREEGIDTRGSDAGKFFLPASSMKNCSAR